MDIKICTKCFSEKPIDQFYKSPGMKDGYRNDCIVCNQAARKLKYDSASAVKRATEWRLANPERFKSTQKKRRESKREEISLKHFAWRFNLSIEEAETWLQLKGQPCLICNEPSTDLDHNHETNIIRGWLCGNCNRGIGLFKDSPDRLREAASYLERFK